MAFEKVARLADVPTECGLEVDIQGIKVGLFRVGDDVHAMENTCPHADFPLSDGTLSDCVITCAAHGWNFDVRTGHMPGNADGFPIPCFAVRIDQDDVWVDIEAPINLRRNRR